MKKGTIIHLKTNKTLDFIYVNRLLILLLFTFLVGLCVVSALYNSNDLIKELGIFLSNIYLKKHIGFSFFKLFSHSLVLTLFVLTVYFTAGTTMLGIILMPIFNFIIGVLQGGVLSYFYNNHSLMGVAFNAVVLIPSFIVSTITLIFASKQSLTFSYDIAKMTFLNSTFNEIPMKFKEYCKHYLIYIFLTLFSAFLEASFTSGLINIFSKEVFYK